MTTDPSAGQYGIEPRGYPPPFPANLKPGGLIVRFFARLIDGIIVGIISFLLSFFTDTLSSIWVTGLFTGLLGAMTRAQSAQQASGPLTVHPAMAAEGLAGPAAQSIKEAMLVFAGEERIVRATFMQLAGPVIGIPFALEGFAFFTEAIFLGVYLYGWERVSPRAHMLAGLIGAASGAASALFVVIVTEQDPVPEHAPPHPVNLKPWAAVACSVTFLPLA